MATIYKTNDILHGCIEIESIFAAANSISRKHNKFIAIVYLVGQYADKMQSSLIRYYWHKLRYYYIIGDLVRFRAIYSNFDTTIYKTLGRFAWCNTITL